MRKKLSPPLIFMLVSISLISLCQEEQFETEMSYKNGEQEARYLKTFRQVPYNIPADYSEYLLHEDSLRQNILNLLNEAGEYASRFLWFKTIDNEHLYMYITDLGNMPFTFQIDKGKFSVVAGFDTTEVPSQVIPLTQSNVINLVQILSDNHLSYEEQYRIYYIITVPALMAIYKNEVLYLPGDKSMFQFDNFVHIVIPPTEQVLYNGLPISIEATAVNVDGQWLVFRGLQGEADFKISLTLDQATKLYKMAFYEVRNLKSAKQSQKLSEKFLDYLNEVTVAVRDDHTQ